MVPWRTGLHGKYKLSRIACSLDVESKSVDRAESFVMRFSIWSAEGISGREASVNLRPSSLLDMPSILDV